MVVFYSEKRLLPDSCCCRSERVSQPFFSTQ
jgi:hypothetical protein